MYSPSLPDITERDRPVCRLVAVTDAPCTEAFAGSCTVLRKVPVVNCAATRHDSVQIVGNSSYPTMQR
jgi:hypothetical protein